MEIRKTRPEDLPEVMKVYAHARSFMKKTDNPTQWGDSYPSEELVRSDIEKGISYVALQDGEVEAVFVFFQGDDPTYHVIEDGSWKNEEPYGVIHRIASMGKVKGSGSACIQWCFSQWPNLRCDTHENNKVMQHVLEKNGFVRCGRIYIADGSPRVAYHACFYSCEQRAK